MKQDARGQQGMVMLGRINKARRTSPGGTQGFVTGTVLPFPVRDRKPPAAEALGHDPIRVQELKARVQSGHYRVLSLRLAGKMIRDDLLEDLSCRKRRPGKALR